MNRLVKAIWPVVVNARLAYLDWAHREIDPLHPDLGHILVKRAFLRDEQRAS